MAPLWIIGGVIWMCVFYFFYAPIPDSLYQYRDDGVITLSHGKNLVDQGFLGVNPSGGRVEGFSSPLHVWTYVLVYGLTGWDWRRFMDFQTWMATFLIGGIWTAFFHPSRHWAWVYSLMGAVLCCRDMPFLLWHGSGMENPWMSLTMLAFLTWLRGSALSARQILMGVFLSWLAAYSRIESIMYVLPVLVLGIGWAPSAAKKVFWWTMGGFVILYSAYHCWRWQYFGTWLPHTALAQGKQFSDTWVKLLAGDRAYWETSLYAAAAIFIRKDAYIFLLLLPFAGPAWKKPGNRVLLLALGWFFVAIHLHPFLFGPTRMDLTRAIAFFTPLGYLGVFILADALSLSNRLRLLAALMILFMLHPYLHYHQQPYEAGWAVETFEALERGALQYSRAYDFPRPLVASPDLGKISYGKQLNILDLGALGAPVLTRLKHDKALMRTFLYDYMAPDFIEIHQGWAAGYYGDLFFDSTFYAMYHPVWEERDPWLEQHAAEWPQAKNGYYFRKALANPGGAEIRLIARLQSKLDPTVVARELSRAIDPDDPAAHQYVVRTVYRLLPEIRRAGLTADFVAAFAATPSAAWDQALLSGATDPHWAEKGAAYFLQEALR